MPGKVFVDPSAPDQPTASFFFSKCARKKSQRYIWRTRAFKHRETRSENWVKQIRTLKVLQFITPDLPATYRLAAEEVYPQNYTVEQP